MKHIQILPIVTFAFCLFTVALRSQEGMTFKHNGEWAAALEQARAENKLIFMDAFTTWCGPCKMMSAQVFPNTDVSKFFNGSFINVKMDMEKGEGIELAQRFKVMAYPTLLFIDPADGSIVHRTAGFHAVDEFIQLGKNALDPAKRLRSMDNRYAKGDRDPEFLFNYTAVKAASYDGSVGPIAEEYLKTQSDWKTERNLKFIFDHVENADSEIFRFLCKNQSLFLKNVGKQAVSDKIEGIVGQSIEGKPDITIEEVNQIFKTAYPDGGEEFASRYRPTFYRNRGDRDNFAKSAIAHYKKYPSKNAEELNTIAWDFFQFIDDEKSLKTAAKWAKKSTKIAPSFYNFDTLAALNYKLKNKKPALKAAQKAIELARAAGEDYTATQELLTKIQAL